jgi:hypothetical protein
MNLPKFFIRPIHWCYVFHLISFIFVHRSKNIMTKIFLAVVCGLFSICCNVHSQPVKDIPKYTYDAGVSYFSGFAMKHDRFMGHLAQGITRGMELHINKSTYGHQVWEQVFRYPDVGFSLSYFDFGSEKLGETLGGLLYVDFFIFSTSRWEGMLRLGTGLGYHTNPYDGETNNQNVAIGSAYTQSMQMKLGINYRLTDRWKMTLAGTISHFSVAAYTQPNKGINIVSANLGCSYRITDQDPDKIPLQENYQYDRRLKYNVNFNYGLKEIPPIGGPKYSVYVMSFYVNKQISRTNIINLGMDGFNNTALKEEMKQKNIEPGTVDHRRIGIMIGHELKLHRLSLLTQFGTYIYRPYKTDKLFYQRLALKFYAGKKVYLHYGFVTHYAKADHLELGLGLSL